MDLIQLLNTQKDFLRKNEVDWINYAVEVGNTSLKKSYEQKAELVKKYNLWDKLAKKQPKNWKEAREIQEKLGFFDDMVGSWATIYVENKVGDKY